MKKMIKYLTLINAAVISLTALADEEKNISVFVKKLNNDDAKVELKVNDKVNVFQLPELEEGEERTITSDSGNTYTISKENGSLKIVGDDGEEILLPTPSKNHMVAKVKALSDGTDLHTEDSIRIMAKGLTDDQKETIKASISAAGIVKPVKFIDDNNFVFITKHGGKDFDAVHDIVIKTVEGEHKEFKVKKDKSN